MKTMIFCLMMLTTAVLEAQCTQGNCENGHGSYTFADSSKYVGGFVDGHIEGRGILYFINGDKYLGEWLDGLRHGKGKFIFSGGDIYTGDFVKNNFDGEGKIIYADGDQYEGVWKNHLPNGHGVYSHASGKVLKGEFVDGGFVSGETIASEEVDVDLEEEKALSQEKFQGYKDIITPDQSKSNFKNCTGKNCHNEIGEYRYLDGSRYEGEFINGHPQGEGVCYYNNGDKYIGYWKNHSPHGLGVMYFASGKIYGADWSYGTPLRELRAEETIDIVKDALVECDEEIKVWAVLIGVSRYAHMPVLRYTDDDAYRIFGFLKSPEGGAIPDEQITILIDEDATREGILNGLQQTLFKADENDVVIVYFSGHGLEGSFVPIDYDGFENQVFHEEVIDIISKSKAKYKMCFADACHAGSLTTQKGGMVKQTIKKYYSAFSETKRGTAFMLSSKAEEYSLEDNGLRQGVFSHFLIRGMKGEADNNDNGIITIGELYKFVHFNVRKYTGNIQNPMMMGSYDKRMPVAVIR